MQYHFKSYPNLPQPPPPFPIFILPVLVNYLSCVYEFQMGDFEVSFTKITTPTEPTKLKNQPNPALKGLMTFYGDIMSPTTDIEDWELD